MDERLRERQELCTLLYEAGLSRDVKLASYLRGQLDKLDEELAVPDIVPTTDPPKVGDLIYLPTRGSIDHGYDDVAGGMGVVSAIKPGISAGDPTIFVTTHEHPGRGYNWEFLGPEQDHFKKDYGSRWARPDPDL